MRRCGGTSLVRLVDPAVAGRHARAGAYPLLALSGVLLCGGWLLLRALMNRDLRLISPFPEGLADDTRLRVLVGGLSRSLGQRVAVDRRVGEGAFSAFHAGIRLARDGSVATIVASDGTSLPNFDAAAYCAGRFRPAAGLSSIPTSQSSAPTTPGRASTMRSPSAVPAICGSPSTITATFAMGSTSGWRTASVPVSRRPTTRMRSSSWPPWRKAPSTSR